MIKSLNASIKAVLTSALLMVAITACGGGAEATKNGASDNSSAVVSSESAAECFTTKIITSELNYSVYASEIGLAGTLSNTSAITDGTSFNGHNNLQRDTMKSIETYGAIIRKSTSDTYSTTEQTSDGLIGYDYGSTTVTDQGTSEDKISPPALERIATLKKGEIFTYTATGKTTFIGLNGKRQESDLGVRIDQTYLGQEKVTVPAGVFDVCVFRMYDQVLQFTNYHYISKSNGVLVLITKNYPKNDASSDSRTELLAGSRVNGVLIQR